MEIVSRGQNEAEIRFRRNDDVSAAWSAKEILRIRVVRIVYLTCTCINIYTERLAVFSVDSRRKNVEEIRKFQEENSRTAFWGGLNAEDKQGWFSFGIRRGKLGAERREPERGGMTFEEIATANAARVTAAATKRIII